MGSCLEHISSKNMSTPGLYCTSKLLTVLYFENSKVRQEISSFIMRKIIRTDFLLPELRYSCL